MSTSTTHTKKTRPSIPTLKTSHLLAQHKNHVTFDPYITTKQFRPPHKNEVNFDPRTKASPLRSPHHNRVNFNPRQKTKVISTPSLKSGQSRYIKSFSTVTQKPSQVRPLYWNEINFDHPHDNHINFIPTLNSSEVPSPTRNQVNFDHPSQLRCLQSNQVISGPHVKPRSISTTHTKKNKSILTPTYETSPFRSHTNTTSISIPTLKLSQLRPPPGTKTKYMSIQRSKPSQFGPPLKTNSSSIPTPISSPFRSPTLKSSQFQPPAQPRQLRPPIQK